MKTAGAERALIFAWEHVWRIPMILPGFLLLSVAGHLGAFFLFRIVYPAQASLLPPPPPVTVLDPSRPDHLALLRWAEAEDPAPAATQSAITDRLLAVQYRPSYATVRTAPLTLPPDPGTMQYPPPRDPLAIIRGVEAQAAPPPAPPRSGPTRVKLGIPLADRMPATARFTFKSKSTAPLDAAEFLIGVTDRGEVRFVVLQHSSGKDALDAEAAAQLTRLSLTRANDPLTWGRATVLWGVDAYAP